MVNSLLDIVRAARHYSFCCRAKKLIQVYGTVRYFKTKAMTLKTLAPIVTLAVSSSQFTGSFFICWIFFFTVAVKLQWVIHHLTRGV